MQTALIRQNVSLLYTQEINQICFPWLAKLNVCILNFIRYRYDTRTVAYVCSNPYWLENYFQKDFPAIGYFETHDLNTRAKPISWNVFDKQDPIMRDSREMFNINGGMTWVRNWQQGKDFFNFGTNALNEKQQLLAQAKELDRFIEYFYDKARHILYRAMQQAYCLDSFQYLLTDPTTTASAKRLYLGQEFGYQYLTVRELEALNELVQGKSIPELAAHLHISKRTAEKHVDSLKQKLGCRSQCQLGFIAASLGLERRIV